MIMKSLQHLNHKMVLEIMKAFHSINLQSHEVVAFSLIHLILSFHNYFILVILIKYFNYVINYTCHLIKCCICVIIILYLSSWLFPLCHNHPYLSFWLSNVIMSYSFHTCSLWLKCRKHAMITCFEYLFALI